ncbi:hypothetical protein V8B97DRAFT_1865601 [Scleroderma yunnanense]
MSTSVTTPGASIEEQASAFADDERIHFSKETETWRLEQEDGTELEYDAAKGTWVPVVDDDLIKKQQAAYSVPGVDEEAPAAPVLKRANKKRKEPEDILASLTAAGPSTKRGKNDKEKPKSKNTAVFVTGLPPDTEVHEIVDTFGKFGVIEEDDEGDPKIKLYARDDGSFSGEALVVYFKEESVSLAINLLDDAELRIGDPSTVMGVQRAEFNRENARGGEVPRRTVDKKKASKRIGKMQKKLQEWDDEDGFGPAKTEDTLNNPDRSSRVVVLKYMFSLEELDEDPTLLLDLKDDVRAECSKLGEVTNVVLYDKESDGVMTVKYRDPLSAQACVLKMNGRFFAGRRIEASLYTGKQRFKRSGVGGDFEGELDEAEKSRLDKFANWLLTEGD